MTLTAQWTTWVTSPLLPPGPGSNKKHSSFPPYYPQWGWLMFLLLLIIIIFDQVSDKSLVQRSSNRTLVPPWWWPPSFRHQPPKPRHHQSSVWHLWLLGPRHCLHCGHGRPSRRPCKTHYRIVWWRDGLIIIHQAMIHGNFRNILQLPDRGYVVSFSKIKNQESTQSKKNVVKMLSFVKTSSKHNLSNEKN